jgi:hypothetical protein
MRRSLHDIALAAAFAASVSGAPSSTHALLTRRSPLAAARAAGTLIPGRADRPSVVGGLIVHAAVSAGWAGVLGFVLPRRHTVAAGALAGLGIAGFDLVVAGGRKRPAIAALPQAWQWADHVAFGAAVGWVLSRTDAAPA